MNEHNMGGLIPDPQFNLNERLNKLEDRIAELEKQNDCPVEHRICRIEDRLAELEKGTAEPKPDWRKLVARLAELEKGKPEPKQWEPKIKLTLTSPPTLPNAEFIKIGDKAFQYIRQLQWLYENYPEETGEWSKETRWLIYFDDNHKKWDTSADYDSPTLNLIYMSLGAAEHLRDDLNSGKVRF